MIFIAIAAVALAGLLTLEHRRQRTQRRWQADRERIAAHQERAARSGVTPHTGQVGPVWRAPRRTTLT